MEGKGFGERSQQALLEMSPAFWVQGDLWGEGSEQSVLILELKLRRTELEKLDNQEKTTDVNLNSL